MDSRTFTTFFSLLALACNVLVVGWVWLRLGARSAAGKARYEAAVGAAGGGALWLAWLIAAVSTAGSLYYSEIVGFEPCLLCWYQRIAMYPMALILAIAAWRMDVDVRRYAYPLAWIGAVVAGYHYLIQRLPDLDAVSCSLDVPCTSTWVERFGFITIPYMALSAFLAIAVLLAVARSAADGAEDGGAMADRPWEAPAGAGTVGGEPTAPEHP